MIPDSENTKAWLEVWNCSGDYISGSAEFSLPEFHRLASTANGLTAGKETGQFYTFKHSFSTHRVPLLHYNDICSTVLCLKLLFHII